MAMYDILCAGGCKMLMGQLGLADVDLAVSLKVLDHQKKLFCKDCSAKIDRPAPKETPIQAISRDLAAISDRVDALAANTPETQILKDLVTLVGKIKNIAGNVLPQADPAPGPSPAPATPA